MVKKKVVFFNRKQVMGFYLLILLLFVSLVNAQSYNKIDDELSIGGHTIKIIDIGSSDVHVDVDGQRGTIFLNTTSLINGVNITLNDLFYHSRVEDRLALLSLVNVFSFPVTSCTEDSECDDGNPCTIDRCTGTPSRCDYDDSHFQINYCLTGDSCCPSDYCTFREDGDCSASPECSKASDCRDDRDISTIRVCNEGFCGFEKITECISGDGYCPDGCFHSLNSDQDCKSANECISHSDCNDNDACTTDKCLPNDKGIKVCIGLVVTQCMSGDGCCPIGCSLKNDNECTSMNVRQESTIITVQCHSDSDCSEGTCIGGQCTIVYEDNKDINIFTRIMAFLKRLFLPGQR